MKKQPGSRSNSLILGDNLEFKLKTCESVNGEMILCKCKFQFLHGVAGNMNTIFKGKIYSLY